MAFKDERQVVREFIAPKIKEKGFKVRQFVKYLSIKEKLKAEDALSDQEKLFSHYGQPDVDLFFWDWEATSARLFAGEVKYFREKPNKKVYPNNFYAGLDEALALLTFGFDAVFLWHFFDEDVPENNRRLTTNLMQMLVGIGSPLNYSAWTIPGATQNNADDTSKNLARLSERITFMSFPLPPNYRMNPLLSQQAVQINRNLLRKAFRII